MVKPAAFDFHALAEQINDAAAHSNTEEDVRIQVEAILKNAGLGWGKYELNVKTHTATISSSRLDSLHSHVVIEYERPGTLPTKSKYEHSISQVKNQIMGLAGDNADELSKYFGVVLDGERIGFVRYRKRLGDFEISKVALHVSPDTIGRLVEAILGLEKKALDATQLLSDLGPSSKVSRALIEAFYYTLDGKMTTRSKLLFDDWKRVFSQVCSYSPEKLKGLEERYGLGQGPVDSEKLLFALHTTLALIMKLLAAEVGSLYVPIAGSYLKTLEEAYLHGYEQLGQKLREVEDGGIFAKLGMTNFIEGDYFGWYLDEWNRPIAAGSSLLIKTLSEYDPSTAELEPDRVKDLFKRLYQNLVPKTVRHDLGEYYTPDWLAEIVLNEVKFTTQDFEKKMGEKSGETPLDLRLLDPACGSGTFLVLAIRRLREYVEEHWLDKSSALDKIVKNVVGFDLNPLAVLASRANYLIAIGDLLRWRELGKQLEIPVYLADSIMVEQKMTVLGTKSFVLRTVVADFEVPISVIEHDSLTRLLGIIEDCVRSEYSPSDFIRSLESDVKVNDSDSHILTTLYKTLLDLEKQGKNRIWIRVLKNSFAPVLTGKFDFVVGNPPWVNWENLPESYRERTKGIWKEYGLFTLSGMEARLGGGRKDISILFTYRCLHRYLAEDGNFGFLITQSVFKSKRAGEGFRKFAVRGTPVRVIKVMDFSDVRPFEGANNMTAAVIFRKGEKTTYPVTYDIWSGPTPDVEASLAEVKLQKTRMLASPSNSTHKLSPWMTLPKVALGIANKVKGQSYYEAHAGVYSGGLNAVYWVKPIEVSSARVANIDSLSHLSKIFQFGKRTVKDVLVENAIESTKIEIKPTKQIIEDFFLYPLIKSRHLRKWRLDGYIYTLQMQDPLKKAGFPENWVKVNFPKTYHYLKSYEAILRERAAYKKYLEGEAFYSMYNVTKATYSPFKVVWNRMGNSLECCVVSRVKDKVLGEKLILPENVLAFISTSDEDEAHYVCAILNSSITSLILGSIASGGKSFGTPKLVESVVKIREFDKANKDHSQLAQLSKEAHQIAQAGLPGLGKIERKIDLTVAEMYGLSKKDLGEIKGAFE